MGFPGCDVADYCDGVIKTEDVLLAFCRFNENAVAAAAVVANVGTYHNVAEIAPIAEVASAGAEP